MMGVYRIRDDDGFVTEWPWPENGLAMTDEELIAWLDACEVEHDARRTRS